MTANRGKSGFLSKVPIFDNAHWLLRLALTMILESACGASGMPP
jgi:hypothetical protein